MGKTVNAQQQLAQFFSDKGYSPVQVAGILGNLTQESNFNPLAVGDGGMSFGIAQWNRDRLDGLKKFAQMQGASHEDLLTQAAYIDHELNNNEKKAGEALRAAQDIPSATAAFLGFERPQGYDPNDPSKAHGWSNRLSAAMNHDAGGVQYADAGNIMTDATYENLPEVPEGFELVTVTSPITGKQYQVTPEEDKRLELAARAGVIEEPGLPPIPEGFELQSDTGPSSPLEVPSVTTAEAIGSGVSQSIPFSDEIFAAAKSWPALLPGGRSFSDVYNEKNQAIRDKNEQAMEQRPLATIGGMIGGALAGGVTTGPSKLAALANSLRTGGTAARIGKGALAGASSGGVYGAGENEDRAGGALSGALLGSAVGAGLPAIGAAASGAANAVIPKAAEELIPLAKRAQEFGIPLRLDQVSPTRARSGVQKVSQSLPFSGSNAFEDAQRDAFNKAVAKTIGQDSLSPDSINSFLKSADDKFSSALKDETLELGQDFTQSLDNIVMSAEDSVTDDVVGIVRRNVDKLKADIGSGQISGEKLASFRSKLIKAIPKADSQARAYLGEIIEKIDDVAAGSMSKEKSDILKQARREWRNFRTIEPLLEKSVDGKINPTELINRVSASPYIKASRNSVGEDDLVDLARIGKQFLYKKGGSDTIEKAGLIGLGAGSLASLPMTAGAIGANRALQSLNTSQRAVSKSLERGALQRLSNPTKRLERNK